MDSVTTKDFVFQNHFGFHFAQHGVPGSAVNFGVMETFILDGHNCMAQT